jgi:hypothetical protein
MLYRDFIQNTAGSLPLKKPPPSGNLLLALVTGV